MREAPPKQEMLASDYPGALWIPFDAELKRVCGIAARDSAIAYLWSPFGEAQNADSYDVDSTTVYMGIAQGRRDAWIVFRGTDNGRDWLRNLNVGRDPAGHAGFLAAWRAAGPTVRAWLERVRPEFDRIFVTGHSLGGALAVLCAIELIADELPLERCITFAAPRAVRFSHPRLSAIRFHHESRFLRAYQPHDLVSKVPPSGIVAHLRNRWFTHFGYSLLRPLDPAYDRYSRILDNRLWTWLFWLLTLPFTILGRIGDKLSGSLGNLEEASGIPSLQRKVSEFLNMFGNLILMFLVLGTGKVGEWIVQAYLIISLPLLALMTAYSAIGFLVSVVFARVTHAVGMFAARARFQHPIEEWLRVSLAARIPSGARYVVLNIPVVGAAQQDRFTKNVQRLIGRRLFETYVRNNVDVAAAADRQDPTRAGAPARPSSIYESCVFLLWCLGYDDAQIQRFVNASTIAIERPAHWRRYYE